MNSPALKPPPITPKRFTECSHCLRAIFPRFDLILLGIGTDGHTASLFPTMPALEAAETLVAYSAVPSYVNPNVARITLTFPTLNAAAHVLFQATGAGKAPAVRDALAGHAAADPSPAGRVRPTDGVLTWLLDADAASLLPLAR